VKSTRFCVNNEVLQEVNQITHEKADGDHDALCVETLALACKVEEAHGEN